MFHRLENSTKPSCISPAVTWTTTLDERTSAGVSPDLVHLFLLRSLIHSGDESDVGSLLWFLLKLQHFILYQESCISLVEVFVLIGIVLVKFCAPDLTLSCLILSRTSLKREQSIERMLINAGCLTQSIPRTEKFKVSSTCCPSLDKQPWATVWKLYGVCFPSILSAFLKVDLKAEVLKNASARKGRLSGLWSETVLFWSAGVKQVVLKDTLGQLLIFYILARRDAWPRPWTHFSGISCIVRQILEICATWKLLKK